MYEVVQGRFDFLFREFVINQDDCRCSRRGGKSMQLNWASKRDWLLFRSKIAGWQEAYIWKLNKEYINLLIGPGSEADKFWELCKRIREDRRCAGVQISMRGSDPLPIICRNVDLPVPFSPTKKVTGFSKANSSSDCRYLTTGKLARYDDCSGNPLSLIPVK